MKVETLFLCGFLCVGTFCAIKSAEPRSIVGVEIPQFVVLAYQQNIFEKAVEIIEKFVGQGLLEILHIQSKAEHTAQVIKNTKVFRINNTYRQPLQYNIVSAAETAFDTLIKDCKQQGRQVIVVCDQYSTQFLQKKLANYGTDPMVHSIILIDPTVYTPRNVRDFSYTPVMNYAAVSNRMYNFYSKATYATYRKYTPEANGFHVQGGSVWSKIVNVCCMYGCSNDEDININLTPETIMLINIPEMIKLADEHFRCNWDLAVMIKKDQKVKREGEIEKFLSSISSTASIIPMFLHRMLELGGDGNLINVQERWLSKNFIGIELGTIRAQLGVEHRYHVEVTAPYYNGSKNQWLCKALEGAPYEPITLEVFSRLKTSHPQWVTEIEKLGPNYYQYVSQFLCLRSDWNVATGKFSGAHQNPLDTYRKFEEWVEVMKRERPSFNDSFIARMLACGALVLHNISSLQGSVRMGFADQDKTQVAIENISQVIQAPSHDPKLYKIHLMPSDQDCIPFFNNLVEFLLKTSIWKSINAVKMIMPDNQFLNVSGAPRIVIYFYSNYSLNAGVEDSKKRIQLVLDKIYDQFKNVPGFGPAPLYNMKVTDLIYFTQGNRDDKILPGAENIFDENEGFVYFKPGYKGYTVDFHLRVPGHSAQ